MGTLDTRRVHWLARLAFVWALLIVMRLIQLKIVQDTAYEKLALQQQQQVVELQARGGAILDRYSQRLAMSLATESICVDPRKIVDMEMAANILAAILNLDAKELLARMQSAGGNKRGFLWVKRKITREEAKRLRDLTLHWIEFPM